MTRAFNDVLFRVVLIIFCEVKKSIIVICAEDLKLVKKYVWLFYQEGDDMQYFSKFNYVHWSYIITYCMVVSME